MAFNSADINAFDRYLGYFVTDRNGELMNTDF